MGLFFTIIISLSSIAHCGEFDHSHSKWGEVLSAHVFEKGPLTLVDYKKLKTSPQALYAYLAEISGVKKTTFDLWSEKQRLAFLINAYNAFTLKLIVDHYPLGSIKDIGGFFSSPWKKKFFRLFGEKIHLDRIEHTLIRENFREPRIHFAVNCASKGCPNLRREPYVAEKLSVQLEEATRSFLNDSTRNRLHVEDDSADLQISSIFKWYKKDFGDSEEGIKRFVIPRMNLDQDQAQQAQTADIEYLDYDWSLNGLSNTK